MRRKIEQAWAARGGRAFLLALDWQRAFDCIDPSRMVTALRRFGLNESMVCAIEDIYAYMSFCVRDGSNVSGEHAQEAGISQGCPLSPLLFGMVMTIVMSDARNRLGTDAWQSCCRDDLSDVLFADDTLLISASPEHLTEYMREITFCGSQFGLQVHWGKVQLLKICSDRIVRTPLGEVLPASDSMVYLGSTLSSDGRLACEISRKIGQASAVFNQLRSVWRHTSISTKRKVELFDALVVSKLRYGTPSAWLLKADFRRLDGFQAACLRRILGIPSALISRVSNKTILQRCKSTELSSIIRKAQLKLRADVLTKPSKRVLRDATFLPGTSVSRTNSYVRRIGRPRQNWADELARCS